MNRRQIFRSLAGLPLIGHLAGKSVAEEKTEDLGPSSLDGKFSFRFADGCIDQEGFGLFSYSKCKVYDHQVYHRRTKGYTEKTIEFYKFQEPHNNLSHEEDGFLWDKCHHRFDASGKYIIEDTYLYENNKKIDEYPWKIQSVALTNGCELGNTIDPIKGNWLRYTYRSIVEDN